MAMVTISNRVLSSIDRVTCESPGSGDLRLLRQAEEFCDGWIQAHSELQAEDDRVQGFQEAGASAFEAQRRVAVSMSADACRDVYGDGVTVLPVPRYADEMRP